MVAKMAVVTYFDWAGEQRRAFSHSPCVHLPGEISELRANSSSLPDRRRVTSVRWIAPTPAKPRVCW